MGEADRLAMAAMFEATIERIVRRVLAEAGASAPKTEGFIGTRESARRGGVKQDTILDWIKREILPATRVEGARGWKIRPEDLDAVLSGKHGGASPVRSPAAPPVPAPVDLAAERGRRLAMTVPRRGGDEL